MPSRPVLVLALSLAGYTIGLIVTFLVLEDWTARQTAAVVLTGAVVIWYTWETMLLREVAVKQRELQLRPFVIFKGDVNGYYVENLGASPALGLNIESVTLVALDFELKIDFPFPIPILRAGEIQPIKAKVILNGREIESVFAAHLDPAYAVEDIDVKLHFRNIEGRVYKLVQTTSPQSLTIKGFH